MTTTIKVTVKFAAAAPLAIALRRGPSDWIRLVLWHTDTDRFVRGQWLRGRVQSLAISPSGRLIAFQGFRGRARHTPRGWIAVSRPPWFTALAAWETYEAHCRFVDDETIFIGEEFGASRLIEGFDGGPLRVVNKPWRDAGPERGPHWQAAKRPAHPSATAVPSDQTFSRLSNTSGTGHIVQARWYAQDHDRSESGLRHWFAASFITGEWIRLPAETTWAGWDQHDRLTYALSDGRLCALQPMGANTGQVLADFSEDRPEPIEAPPEARVWPA